MAKNASIIANEVCADAPKAGASSSLKVLKQWREIRKHNPGFDIGFGSDSLSRMAEDICGYAWDLMETKLTIPGDESQGFKRVYFFQVFF